MAKDKKESAFDRIKTSAGKAGKWLSESPKSVERVADYAKSKGVSKRGVDFIKPSRADIAIGVGTVGAGLVASKVLKGIGKARKAAKSAEQLEKLKPYVKESNRIDELAKSKDIYTVKNTAGKAKKATSYVKRNKYSSANMEKKDALKGKDLKNDFSLAPNSRVSEEFTSRGKKIGKPIGDQGGSRGKQSNAGVVARDKKKVITENKREASFKRHAGSTVKDPIKGTKTHVMKPGLRGEAERKYGDSKFGPYPINRGKKINRKGYAN